MLARGLTVLVGLFASLALFLAVSSSAHAAQLTAAGDPIVGIAATVIGGNSTAATAGTGANQFPAGEPPSSAIDQKFQQPYTTAGTKYLNFGAGASGVTSATKGVGTGFYVTPAVGASIANAIQVATANDAAERDPLTVSIEGSNATGANLALGSSWTLIAASVNLGIDAETPRYTQGPVVLFANTTAFTSYRVLVQSQRGVGNSVQYGEMNLFNIPEPASLASLAFGAVSMVAAVRRRRA